MNTQEEQKEQAEQVQDKNIKARPLGLTHKTFVLIGLVLVLVFGTVTGGYFLGAKKNEPKACTLEAKQCPDGSYVSRTGPNCEFSPCPTTPTPTSSSTDQTSSWKTYINTTYGYEIKYPPNAKQSQFSLDSQFWLNLNESYVVASQGEEIKQNFSVSIVEVPNFSKKDFPEFFKEYAATKIKYENLIYSLESAVKNYPAFRNNSLIIPSGTKILQVFVQSADKTRHIVFSLTPYDSQKPFENQESALAVLNQILSTFKFTSASDSSSVPSDWTLKQDTACNVVFPIPPKKAPYYTPDDLDTYSDLAEDGAFWQFQENNEGSSLFAYYKRVLFHNPKAGGSGYIPGLVSISCSTNENKYTNDILLERYKKTFEAASSEIEVSETKELNLWGRKVYAVYVKGGMFDENNPTYLFATDKHIYSVSKIAMSSNSFVKETAETIFNNLNFKD